MRFTRQQPAATTLSEVSLRDLHLELERRGWQMLPAGAWDELVSELERHRRAPARLVPNGKEWFDGTEAVTRLGHLAGTVLPEAVDRVNELGAETAGLRDRAHRAESEAALLAHQMMAPELWTLERLEDDQED